MSIIHYTLYIVHGALCVTLSRVAAYRSRRGVPGLSKVHTCPSLLVFWFSLSVVGGC